MNEIKLSNKIYRKYIANHWWQKKRKINQDYINHICKKCKINGKIISYPYFDKEKDMWISGVLEISKDIKGFIKYKEMMLYNRFRIICDNEPIEHF